MAGKFVDGAAALLGERDDAVRQQCSCLLSCAGLLHQFRCTGHRLWDVCAVGFARWTVGDLTGHCFRSCFGHRRFGTHAAYRFPYALQDACGGIDCADRCTWEYAGHLVPIPFLFSLTAHNITGTNLLQIIQFLGGDSGNLCITMAIQALVEALVRFGFPLMLKQFCSGTLVLIAIRGYALKAPLYALAHTLPAIWLLQVTQYVGRANDHKRTSIETQR